MQATVTHVGVCVSDIERSLRFYRDVLGFQFAHEIEVEGEPSDTLLGLRDVSLRAVYLERDGLRLELLNYANPASPTRAPARAMNDLGFTHLSILVPSLEHALEELAAAGVEIRHETLVELGGQRVAVFVRDPDGLPIELVWAGPQP